MAFGKMICCEVCVNTTQNDDKQKARTNSMVYVLFSVHHPITRTVFPSISVFFCLLLFLLFVQYKIVIVICEHMRNNVFMFRRDQMSGQRASLFLSATYLFLFFNCRFCSFASINQYKIIIFFSHTLSLSSSHSLILLFTHK